MTRQLPLPFSPDVRFRADDFLRSDANIEAVSWIEDVALWPALRLAVHGEPGSGKTHLLHLFAERRGAVLLRGGALGAAFDIPPGCAIAIDDADAAPEAEALLHLLNMASEARAPVLLAGRKPPSQWQVGLPDLESRLRATTAVGLGQPDDALLAALLSRLLADRQLRVEPGLQAYLLARLPRHGAALRAAASRLDTLSLASGGKVTRSVAAEVVRIGLDDDDPVSDDGHSPDAVTLL